MSWRVWNGINLRTESSVKIIPQYLEENLVFDCLSKCVKHEYS